MWKGLFRVEWLTRVSLRRPWLILGFIGLISVLAGFGLTRVESRTGFRTFLGEDNPQVHYLDEFTNRFGGGFPLLIVYSCDAAAPCSTVFEPGPLEMAHQLRLKLRVLEGVRDVHTPADSDLLVPTPDGFEVHTLYQADNLEELAAVAAVDPLWEGTIASQEGKVGAVIVEFSSSDAGIQRDVTLYARDLLQPYESQGYEFRLVGESVDFVVAPNAFNQETKRVMPFMVFTMIGILAYLFRSVVAVAIGFATMGLASLWSQGILGLLGFPVDAMTQNVPTIVLVVGICNAVHVLSRFSDEALGRYLDTKEERIEVLLIVVRDIGRSCLLTSLTTALAFAAFMTSSFESFQHFGLVSAGGVMCAFLLTFSLLPILVASSRADWIRSVKASEFWEDLTSTLIWMGKDYSKSILAIGLATMLIGAYGVSQITVETNHYSLLGRDNLVVRWANWVEDNLRAPENIELELVMPEGKSLEDPEAVAVVARVADFLSSEFEGVGRVHSILGPMQRVYNLLNEANSEYDVLPSNSTALAELFLFMPPSISGNWMTLDRRHIRLSAEAGSMSTSMQSEIVQSIEIYLGRDLPSGWTYGLTGSLPIFAAMMDTMLVSQVKTFSVAFIAVWLCFWVYFRSFTISVLGMFPSVLPVVMMLGTLGFWGIPLDVGMTMAAAVVLGLAVDDTIHLLVQYRRRAQVGESPTQAMEGALRHVGRSVVTTSLALSLSFLGLTFLSSFEAVSNFGLMASIATISALLADLILVPAIVHVAPEYLSEVGKRPWDPICQNSEMVETAGD